MKKTIILLLFFCIVINASANTIPISDETVKLQIFLDEHNFSPGKIDGHGKQLTQQALEQYKLANNIGADMKVSPITPLYIYYKIRPQDKKYIGSVPGTPKAQSRKKRMPYTTYGELVAERFHADIELLKMLNPDKKLNKLKVGDELKVPNVFPFYIEELKTGMDLKKKPEFSTRFLKINTDKNLLTLYENNKVIASFPITAGSDELPAPKGTWKLQKIIYLPWFRYDEKMLKQGKRGSKFYMIPPGPNSAVGVVWMTLNKKGIGIHGTDKPETISRTFSHGCIRLTNWDAVKLSKMITIGIRVQID